MCVAGVKGVKGVGWGKILTDSCIQRPSTTKVMLRQNPNDQATHKKKSDSLYITVCWKRATYEREREREKDMLPCSTHIISCDQLLGATDES